MEQRTGKTRIVLETVKHLHGTAGLNLLIIIAPNGVHRNWLDEEIPRWISDTATASYAWLSSTSSRADNVALRASLAAETRLVVVAVNIEALRLDRCFSWLVSLLRARRGMIVIDESQVIGTPGAQQTKRALRLRPLARWRRILSGTPNAESPFQLWSQFAFLDPDIIGIRTYSAFKVRYGVFEEGYGAGGSTFKRLVEYRNLEDLKQRIDPYVFRVRRADCADLPPKIYEKKFFDLSKQQRRVYDELRTTFAAELHDGRSITASMVLVRYLRLQQISSNFLPPTEAVEPHEACGGEGCDACEMLGVVLKEYEAVRIDGQNTRLAAAAEVIEAELAAGGKVLAWARFRYDIDDIAGWARERGIKCGIIDGRVRLDERRRLMQEFQAGELPLIAAQQRAAGRGLRFDAATLLLYYSNHHSLEQRLQSEDRAESLDKSSSTQVIDLVANQTVDEPIVQAFRDKQSLASLIMGDPEREWI